MRIKISLLLCCFQLIFVGSAFAQSARVSINKNNVQLEQVLAEIESQTDYLFVVNNQVDVKQIVSVDASNAAVSQVLNDIFRNTNIAYGQEGTHIVLSVRETPRGSSQPAGQVTGKVTDRDGVPLLGVSIVVKETMSGTSSDVNGNFAVNAAPGQVLAISYLGYEPMEMTVGQSRIVDIVMEEDNMVIDNVVVTALGIRRAEKALSYNVQELRAEDVTMVKDANFVSSLQGKVAGVNINTSSSGIGGATRVVMRGAKSLTKDNNAIYVIDGIPMVNTNNGALETPGTAEMNLQTRGESISDLNPDDIESMTVLTGAAAAALYGSSAANGAIVITTKKGQAGKPQITITNQTTFSTPAILSKFQNKYGNVPGNYSSWGAAIPGGSSYDVRDFFNTGSNVQTSVSLSGGTDRNQTYISLSNTTADGVIPTNEFNRNTINFRNTTTFFNDKLTVDANIQYTEQNDRNMITQGQYYNPLIPVYTYPRGESFDDAKLFELYDPSLEYNVQNWKWGPQSELMQNPYWVLHRNPQTNKRNRTMLNLTISYEATDWLTISARARSDRSNGLFQRKLYASTEGTFAGEFGLYREMEEEDRVNYADLLLNANKRWNKFTVSGILGTSIQDTYTRDLGANGHLKTTGSGLPNFFALHNIDLTPGRGYIISNKSRAQEQSIFASAEVGFADMVYLSATYRIDWASQLANTSSTNFQYPSVGLSALIHEMVTLPKFITFLKLRGSYASVGSPIPVGFSILTREYRPQSGEYVKLAKQQVGDYKAERTNSWEVGLQARFLGGRLMLDATYYNTNTFNQSFNIQYTAIDGQGSTLAIQTGDVLNRGVELMLGYNDKWGDFGWETNLVASYNYNKVLEMVNNYLFNGQYLNLQRISPARTGSLIFNIDEGGTMGDLWTTTKLARDMNGYISVDENGYVSIDEQSDPVKVGSTLPKWTGSWRNGFTYKNFSLNFMFSGRFGGVVASPTQAVLDGYGVSQVTADARDRGGIALNNGTVDAQKYYQTVGLGKVYSHYIYSATNIRLQEVSLGYDFPSAWFNDKINLRASLVGRNLWMIYCKAPFDPELTASTGTYFQGIDYFMQPGQRTFGFNIQLKF